MDILILLTMKEAKRHDIIRRLIEKKINQEEARIMIGLKSIRQIRRIKNRVIQEGLSGVIHRARGQPSHKKFSQPVIDQIVNLLIEKYADFKPTFAAEKLRENHHLKINKESLRQIMISHQLWKPRSRKKAKHRHVWRPRKNNYGEMDQFDGSYHDWFENGKEACLLASIDDATGKITHAKFEQNEGVKAVFGFWMDYFKKNGLPVSIYLDKFSTYKVNHPLAEDNKDLITQFQRATNQTGIKLITAHSPEAKGRVERLFGTLQDRLVKELRLKQIKTIKEANKFLEKYLPEFNKKFAVIPTNKADLHRSINPQLNDKLPQIFSIQSARKIMNDYTIMFKNQFFQLEEKQPTSVFKKDVVIIEEHLNGLIKIDFKGHYLNYIVLPERPKKHDIPLVALTRQKAPWIPPLDHPWRKHVSVKKLSTDTAQLTTK